MFKVNNKNTRTTSITSQRKKFTQQKSWQLFCRVNFFSQRDNLQNKKTLYYHNILYYQF